MHGPITSHGRRLLPADHDVAVDCPDANRSPSAANSLIRADKTARCAVGRVPFSRLGNGQGPITLYSRRTPSAVRVSRLEIEVRRKTSRHVQRHCSISGGDVDVARIVAIDSDRNIPRARVRLGRSCERSDTDVAAASVSVHFAAGATDRDFAASCAHRCAARRLSEAYTASRFSYEQSSVTRATHAIAAAPGIRHPFFAVQYVACARAPSQPAIDVLNQYSATTGAYRSGESRPRHFHRPTTGREISMTACSIDSNLTAPYRSGELTPDVGYPHSSAGRVQAHVESPRNHQFDP